MKKIVLFLFITLFLFCGCSTTVEDLMPEIPVISGDFEVHFINVGQADSALIVCEGKTMLIDGGNVADSSFLYSYLKKYSVDVLDYVVLTHAHEDHVGGLPGAMRYADVGAVIAPDAASDSKCYKDFETAVAEQGLSIEHPEPGERFKLGGSVVEIFGPISNNAEELNNTSVILKITYGEISVLFTGDAEYEEEQSVLNAGVNLESTVMKAPHHGSDTSSSYSFLREVMPEYIVISCGYNNTYGHPHESVLSRYAALGAEVYRTDRHGTVILKSDGRELSFEAEKKTDNKIISENETSGGDYIGNIKSKKYHSPECNALPNEKNRVFFASSADAEKEGYSPCGNCLN